MWHSRSNPVYWVKNLAVFFRALPILADARQHGVTHLHANFGSSPATIAWLGKEMLGVGMSITFHAFDIYSNALSYRDPLKQLKLRDANLVVAVHEDGRRVLRGLVPGADASKFEVIRICVAFEPKDKPDVLPEPPLIVAAGNFVPKKGFDVLIRAVGSLRKRGINVRLRILGDGGERAALESLVRRESLDDRVELPGYFQHEELSGHLAEAAMFAVPSVVTSEGQRDGIPTVVVEAWLSETPVVASLVGGMGEVIIDGKTGLVFDPGHVEQLADCIARLTVDGELSRALAVAGRDAAREWFSPDKNARSLLRHIQYREDVPNE